MDRFAAAVKVFERLVLAGFCLVLASSTAHASPIPFPSGFIPLTSLAYVSAHDANGVRLVMGYSTFQAFATIRALPEPSFENESFADFSIALAPGDIFSNVYVPTSAERDGDFRDFGGPFIDPFSGYPFPQNIIPASLLGGIYAFRVAPAAPVPEPRPVYTIAAGVGTAIALLLRKRAKAAERLFR